MKGSPFKLKSPLLEKSLGEKAISIGSNLLKGGAGLASAMLSPTAAYGGQIQFQENPLHQTGGPLPYPVKKELKHSEKTTVIDESNLGPKSKEGRAERKEFREERRAERKDKKEIRKTTKGKGRNFRSAEEGAGMTSKGVSEYKKKNPGSNLQTAVTGDVKPGSKAAKRRKSFCARSKGWTGERGKAARKRWKC
mgnify:CR=1 FL=1